MSSSSAAICSSRSRCPGPSSILPLNTVAVLSGLIAIQESIAFASGGPATSPRFATASVRLARREARGRRRTAGPEPGRLLDRDQPGQHGDGLPRQGRARARVADRAAADRRGGARPDDGAGPRSPRRHEREPDQGFTAGSTSISAGGVQVREGCGRGTQALLGLASANSASPRRALNVSKGVVSGGGQTVKYGELIGGRLFNVKMTGTAPIKTPSEYKLVGTRAPRIDIPAKVSGTYTYMHNVRVPGMLHGRIVRPKGQFAYGLGAKPLSVDESSIKKIKGAQVVRKGDFVGIVAPHEYDAIQAAAQLKVKWSTTPTLPGNGDLVGAMRAAKTADSTPVNKGDSTPGSRRRRRSSRGRSSTAYQSHGDDRPVVRDRRRQGRPATVSARPSCPYATRASIARTLGLADLKQVRLQMVEGSGCYGHSCYDDAAARCGGAVAGRRQAGARPVHARGRARLGQLRARAGHRHGGRRRRGREDRRVRLHRLVTRAGCRRRRRRSSSARRSGRPFVVPTARTRARSTRSRTGGSRPGSPERRLRLPQDRLDRGRPGRRRRCSRRSR